ncbi:MAG: hypothetical protein COA78_28330 [Blastopirellula sp.]|nr:MAG: hypothetical protein COA78_28330 [Blastopirellula sp.]
MKLLIFALLFVISIAPASADTCQDRFTELLVPGNQKMGPVRIHLTQEIVGGKTSINYHYSDGKISGMTEMIDPANDPWSLFLGDNMYRSNDKGKTWSFMNSYDSKKSLADTKKSITSDAAKASGVACGKEEYEGISHEVVEGNYISSMSNGAAIYEKLWVNPSTGWIVKSYRHIKSGGFESKTTQLIELFPNLTLPKPE